MFVINKTEVTVLLQSQLRSVSEPHQVSTIKLLQVTGRVEIKIKLSRLIFPQQSHLLKLLHRSIKRPTAGLQTDYETTGSTSALVTSFVWRSPERILASSALHSQQASVLTREPSPRIYLELFNLFLEVCFIFFLLVCVGCIVKLWMKHTEGHTCQAENNTEHALVVFWKRSAQKIQTWWLIMQSEKSFTSLSNLFCSFWDNPINLWVEMMFFL